MPIAVGERIPDLELRVMTADGVRPVRTSEIFAGKRVVLFAVPGAFTPTCSDTHLPGYQVRAPELLEAGADAIVCVSVNDAHVMEAWRKARGIRDEIRMLADGSGDFTRAMGLELDLRAAGMGVRSRRYAALVEDGTVRALEIESGRGVTVSSAEAMLARLHADGPASS